MKTKFQQMMVASFVAMGIFWTGTTITHAEPTSNIQQQIDVLESDIQKLDNSIVESMVKIEELEKEIGTREKEATQIKAEIQTAEEKYKITLEHYMERLKYIQLEGDPYSNLFLLILSSEGFSDFIHRSFLVSQIIESDQEFLDSLDEQQKELTDKKNALEKTLQELGKKQTALKNEKTELERKKESVLNQIEQLKERQRIQQLTPTPSWFPQTSLPNNISYSSDKAKSVISNAYQYLGVPYVWGGTTPNGFDCSGLTQYVYRSVGVHLPRVARDQQNFGTQIPLQQIQPGDLVFFGKPAHHVGIYIGNGQYLHAPQTGDVVKISNLNPSRVSSVSRVLH